TNTMDVAPYIKDDRTYLPIRYVGYALGIADHNILWDDASKTATLIQGDKVVQVKIGSTTMMVNGVAIAMDVAPEITSDRTMLPFRFIGQAFGADFAWDDATKTVTMTL
ncbi:MAG: copper amine oxidase N-terminal domain-containing protein, partial [Dehalococcoidales bacterium]|nr:copper amine oxidase N-terminal domain-containing protein [Dehalococcoidales bacterium]